MALTRSEVALASSGRVGSLSPAIPSVSRVPDIGQGPCREATAGSAGVGGLCYLPAVQGPFPDTFISATILAAD